MAHPSNRGNSTLLWIGGFKLGKGLLLLCVASGILAFVHRDAEAIVEHWVEQLRFDPDNGHITSLLQSIGLVTDRQLKELSGLTFVYAAMFLTEGAGLLFRKRWAEYLTTFATASLIPIEVYETFRHCTVIRVLLVLLNVAIVCYLIQVLRRGKTVEESAAG
jgi:uncharacterized membrane protein (DUF2068 family)